MFALHPGLLQNDLTLLPLSTPCGQNRNSYTRRPCCPTAQFDTTCSIHCDEDESVIVTMDVPGVKTSDIKVKQINRSRIYVTATRKNGDNSIGQYQKTFLVNPRAFDVSNVKTDLTNGVLTLTIPKKSTHDPIIVPISISDPIETVDHALHILTVDVPGVKATSLTVKYHDGFILLEGTKKWANENIKFEKKILVDNGNIDGKQLQAHLVDGVLTVTVPLAKVDAADVKDNDIYGPVLTSMIPDSDDDNDAQKLEVDECSSNDTEESHDSMVIIEPSQKIAVAPSQKIAIEKVTVETVDEKDEWVTLPSK